MYMDALICPVIVGNRIIQASTATNLANPVLTRAEGYLRIRNNNRLTRIDFASLSYIGNYLIIQGNPTLTFATLPRLSQVQNEIFFCENAPSFIIPNAASGTAAPPGLTSVQLKGQFLCQLRDGSAICITVTCP
jgi:hypothetical protein